MKEQIKRKLRIYIDTSVVGGFFDKEFETETKALFKRLENNEVVFVVSDVLENELEKSPPQVKELLNKYKIGGGIVSVKLTDEAKVLANAYIAEGIVGIKHLEDCQHIALATINNVTVLAS